MDVKELLRPLKEEAPEIDTEKAASILMALDGMSIEAARRLLKLCCELLEKETVNTAQ